MLMACACGNRYSYNDSLMVVDSLCGTDPQGAVEYIDSIDRCETFNEESQWWPPY